VNSSQTSKAVSWSAKKGMEETVAEEMPVAAAAEEEEEEAWWLAALGEGEGEEKEEEEVEESMLGTEVADATRRPSAEPMEGRVGFRSAKSWDKQHSAARSQACHRGCCAVEASRGMEVGVQLNDLNIRSANRKLRNKLATNKSCRNSL